MRFTLFTLLLFLSINAKGQTLDTAVFKDCLNTTSPTICTEEKFKDDISALMTYDIANQIKETLKENYFSVSIIFLTDETGKLTPEYTDVRCDFPGFKTAIENYINNLPVLTPKDSSYPDRRTLHTLYYTFMPDYVTKKFYLASEERLKAEKIAPQYFYADTPALYPKCNCKKTDREKLMNQCTKEKILKYINKNFNIPNTPEGNPRSVKIYISMQINKDGIVKVLRAISTEKELSDEAERVINSLPVMKPARIKGFPVTTVLTLPITITYHK